MANPSSSDYHRGEMDIHEQSATYAGFMALTKWGSLITAVGILFITLWFCTKAGFVGSAFSAIVLGVIGFLLLRGKAEH